MHKELFERLACPVCHGALTTEGDALCCKRCGLAFTQAQGVPCLFGPGKEDLWASNQGGLARFFEEHPTVAAALEQADEDRLNGADLSAKAGLRQAQGRFREAAELHQAASWKCYPEGYIRTFERQLDFIAQQLKDCAGPVVDIASGRGMLVSHLLDRIAAPLAATDLSPSVLANYQASRWPEAIENGKLSLLAFDAAEIPFRDRSLPAVTTCVGLQNIPGPENAIRELRRVCGGTLYALCYFFPEDDRENQEAAERFGLAGAYSCRELTKKLQAAGFHVDYFETPAFHQQPTPLGQVVPGMRVDGLPVAETEARFITLICQ